MRKAFVLIMLLVAALVSGQDAPAATMWVSPTASSPAPGTSCRTAGYTAIQAAINAASAGDTVSVCPGTYVENITINKANLMVSSTGGSGVTAAPSTRFTTTPSAAALSRIRFLAVRDLTSTASITTPPNGLPCSATGTLCTTTLLNCSTSPPATPPTSR
jgi:hypothetical protein